ncbi:MAG: hypothetical protein FJX59_02450 [Alphaproteobacteria bacterium]|nr:hypothetical protein [Alphaproteobacteria bacterium]
MRVRSQVLSFASAVVLAAPCFAAETGIVHDRRMGFVVKDWFTAVYETKFMDECPEGVSIANDEVWWRRLSRADKDEQTGNGMIQALNRVGVSFLRGRNGEHVCLEPDSVDDPPQRIVEGKLSFGVNLDGDADGKASAKSCAHENFTHPDGTTGIDNQMYRLVGCTYGWRKDVGTVDMNANEMRNTSGLGLILIDVSEVDNPRNDDDVTVTFYRSVDQWVQDSKGAPLPFQTFNIDVVDGKPRYGDSIKGAIKDGVLTTKNGDVRLPWYGNYVFMHPVIRDLTLRLDIDPSGERATGMVAGYYDVEAFTYYIGSLGAVVPVNGINCSSLIKAARELADGYPDPKTGKCTALSSAFDLLAYAAYIRLPAAAATKTAER